MSDLTLPACPIFRANAADQANAAAIAARLRAVGADPTPTAIMRAALRLAAAAQPAGLDTNSRGLLTEAAPTGANSEL